MIDGGSRRSAAWKLWATVAVYAIAAVATVVTYTRLPSGGTYNFEGTGLVDGGLSRLVSDLSFPVALAGIAWALVAISVLGGRARVAGIVAAVSVRRHRAARRQLHRRSGGAVGERPPRCGRGAGGRARGDGVLHAAAAPDVARRRPRPAVAGGAARPVGDPLDGRRARAVRERHPAGRRPVERQRADAGRARPAVRPPRPSRGPVRRAAGGDGARAVAAAGRGAALRRSGAASPATSP